MEDQEMHENAGPSPATAVVDVFRTSNRIMAVRAERRGWKTANQLHDAVQSYVEARDLDRTMSRSQLGRIERGEVSPEVDELLLLADVIGCELMDLIVRKD